MRNNAGKKDSKIWSSTGIFFPLGKFRRRLIKLDNRSPAMVSNEAIPAAHKFIPSRGKTAIPPAILTTNPRIVLCGPKTGCWSSHSLFPSSGLLNRSPHIKLAAGGRKLTHKMNPVILRTMNTLILFSLAGCQLRSVNKMPFFSWQPGCLE